MSYKLILSIKLIILSILLFSTLGNRCGDDVGSDETPPDSTGCGVGTGDYKFSVVNTVPDTFDCNEAGGFVITIRPNIHLSYYGIDIFNRLYFVLDNGRFCISNYVEFLSDNYEDQQLEWGGSLPTGDYEVRGRMKNIQLNSTCRDSIYKAAYLDMGTIHIIEFTNPEKVMQIEYSCQESDTSEIERYDVFLAPNTKEYIDIAFNVANTGYDVTTYLLYLTPALIEYDLSEIMDYIRTVRYSDNKMFLCGVKGFKYQGNYIIDLLGLTSVDTSSFAITDSTGSLVAVKTCIDFAADKYRIDYNDFVTATTIHELGWQRAIKPTDNHNSEFCIMNVGLVVDTTEVPFNRYSNPHFCDFCISRIKNKGW